ncbi:oxidoreductase [Nocardioides guangzhouensis]|uniref:Oxidoreductase n=1 Tax=Nocardioides guangzhouensis TaxID=2497878 RepID=A0A4Q4ZGF3_9ACTN|nr:oxidoreductase [Nocardioides guangzhouensis]RYP87270.1 oxidoreductase [Nocardioides guangzhouensis]
MSPDSRADQSTDPLGRLAALEGVPSAYAAARDGVDALLRDRGLRRTSPEQTAESLLLGAWASAQLEGSASTLEEVRERGGDETAQAAVRVSTEMLALVPALSRSPLQAFARLHALAGTGTVPDDELGRPRSAAAAERLRMLATRLLDDTAAPAMLVAAVVHAELAAGAPFASHNGIVARAAERLVLVARGVDEKSLLVPEEGHRRLRSAYESNLRAYASAAGTSGVQAWLLYTAEAYTLAAEASPARPS